MAAPWHPGFIDSEKRAGSVHNALFGADHRINVVSASVVAGLPDHFIIWPIGNGAVAQVLCQACLEFSLCKVSWAIRNYRRLVRGRRGRPATAVRPLYGLRSMAVRTRSIVNPFYCEPYLPTKTKKTRRGVVEHAKVHNAGHRAMVSMGGAPPRRRSRRGARDAAREQPEQPSSQGRFHGITTE